MKIRTFSFININIVIAKFLCLDILVEISDNTFIIKLTIFVFIHLKQKWLNNYKIKL